MSNHEMAQLIRALRRQGHTIRVLRSGRYQVTSTTGGRAVIPKTPRDGRALANARAALRRIGADV